ncbi:MAG: transporter substrate-binding domain-containing protein [Blautia sp.]|nr:transporter substrate-binding domain-containing protein [Blautia sp.]
MRFSSLFRRGFSFALCAAAVCGWSASAEEEQNGQIYAENEWNYVDVSLDTSKGIPEDAAGRLLAIKQTGRLTVATEPYFAPQEFIDPALSGQESYVGADMELARLIAERMDVELEIVPLEFTRVLTSVADGSYDLAISGLAYTPERTVDLELSKGYYYAEAGESNALIVREKDLKEIKDTEDLGDKNIIAQMGSLQESLGVDNIPLYHEFRRVSSMDEIYDSLISGDSDAAIVDIDNAKAYIASNPECGLALVPDLFFSMDEQYKGDRIAAKKGETMLIAFVNGVIDEVLESGEYNEWFEEYSEYAANIGE